MKTISPFIISSSLVISCGFSAGCEYLDARDAAYAGERALRQCEFESAYRDFSFAADVFPDHRDIRFGLAISDLLAFLGDPNIVGLTDSLGLNLRVSSLCDEEDSSDNGETPPSGTNPNPNPNDDSPKCLDISSVTKSAANESPGSDANPNDDAENASSRYYDDIDENLKWHDIIMTLMPYRQRLVDMAREFRRSAQKIDGFNGYSVDFPSSSTTIYPWDMNLTASLLLAIVMIIDWVEVYETDFHVIETLRILSDETCENSSAFLNERVLLGQPGVSIEKTTWPVAQELFELLGNACDDAYEWKLAQLDGKIEHVACPILNWQETPFGILKDISRIAHAFSQPPYVTDWIFDPDIHVRLKDFFSDVPVRSQRVGDAFTCTKNGELSWNGVSFAERVNASCDPKIFDISEENVSISPNIHHRLSSAWLKWTPKDFFTPPKINKK